MSCSVLFSQQKQITIAGKILDEEGRSITGVSLIDSIGKKNAFFQDSIRYTISTSKKKAILLVKSQGYVTQKIPITRNLMSTAQNDTVFLDIVLLPEAVELESVDIGSVVDTFDWNRPIFVSGKILDEYGEPILHVNVNENRTKKSAKIIGPGQFTIRVQGKRSILVFKAFGYQTKRMLLTKSILSGAKDDSLTLVVRLEHSITELESVDIVSKSIQRVYDKPQTLILDYEVLEVGFILLLKEGKSYFIREVDFADKTMAERKLEFKPTKLFRNCFGEVMLLSSDSAYQLFVSENQMLFSSVYDLAQFKSFVEPCVAAFPSVVFFMDHAMHGQQVIYTYAQKNKSTQVLRVVVDRDKAKGMEEFKARNEAELGGSSLVGELDSDQLRALRNAITDRFFYDQILSKPEYHPLFKSNHQLYLFDHLVDSVITYSRSGTKLGGRPISHHHLKGWEEQIVLDRISNTFYTWTKRDGMVIVYELSKTDFQPCKKYECQEHAFIENIKIHNGNLYYLYREKNDFAVNNLYRQRMEK